MNKDWWLLEDLEKSIEGLENKLNSFRNYLPANGKISLSTEWICENIIDISIEDLDMAHKKNIAKQRLDLLDGL